MNRTKENHEYSLLFKLQSVPKGVFTFGTRIQNLHLGGEGFVTFV